MKQAFELRSKLVDGLLAGGVLVLLELLLILLIQPVQLIFSRPGLLVYTVSLMAVAVLCLEQSLSTEKDEMNQAWWGTLGGILGWVVIELGTWLGGQSMIGESAIFSLMFIFLIVSSLWRHTQLLGFRYFVVLIFLGWVGHVAIQGVVLLVIYMPQLGLTLQWIGYLAWVGLAAALLYNFFGTRSRQERLDAAIMAWFAVMVLIYAFRGGFI
jgi:hypothetical protein